MPAATARFRGYGVALARANGGARGGEVRRQAAALIAKDQAEGMATSSFQTGYGSLQHEQAEISAGILFQVAFHAIKEANRRENSAPMLANHPGVVDIHRRCDDGDILKAKPRAVRRMVPALPASMG